MLLNFEQRFEAPILAKIKRHTIRAPRKRRPRVGETCHCYTGLRHPGARLIGRWRCVKVQYITIKLRHYAFMGVYARIRIDGVLLRGEDEYERFAQSDGFNSLAEMFAYWKGKLPFYGDLIHWDPEQRVVGANRNRRAKIAREL